MRGDIFVWNENKNQFNIRKHGVSFQEAREVLMTKTLYMMLILNIRTMKNVLLL